MSGSHELPDEIITEIIEFIACVNPKGECIGSKELCQLRLVSKHLNNIVFPLLFSTLNLVFKDEGYDNPSQPDFKRCQEIIEALATRSTTVFSQTKRLHFHPIVGIWRFPALTAAKPLFLDNIFDAICALQNLRVIHWVSHSEYGHREMVAKVFDALGTLPSFQGFEDLHLRNTLPPSFTFQPLSNLTIFRIQWNLDRSESFFPETASLLSRCPNIDEISLSGPYQVRGAPSLLEILPPIDQLEKPWRLQKLELKNVKVTPDNIRTYIQHLKYLTFLGILQNTDLKARTTFGHICHVLRQNNIVLRGVLTDLPEDPLLLSYLSSFSGLTSLRLEVSPKEYDNPEVINQIYMEVLPKHAETLECFEMGWSRPPTNEQLAELVKCQRLTRLQAHCSLSNMEIIRGNLSIYEMWLEAGLQLPNLTLLLLPLTPTYLSPRTFSQIPSDLSEKYRRERGMKFRVNDVRYI